MQRVTKRGRLLGISLCIRWERCMCGEGSDGSHVLALGTWWLVLPFFQNGGQWKRSLISSTSVPSPSFLLHTNPPNSVSWDQFQSHIMKFLCPVSLYSTIFSIYSCNTLDLFFSMSLWPHVLLCLFFLSVLSCFPCFFLYSIPFFFLRHSPPLSPLPGCSQLVLETYNVPELSAGVNCTFEDLSEMDGLVVGNQIQCYSPAAKEVPRIITENGEWSPGAKLRGMSFPQPG